MGNIYQTIQNLVKQNKTVLLATTLSADRKGKTDILERRLINESELLQEGNQLFQKAYLSSFVNKN